MKNLKIMILSVFWLIILTLISTAEEITWEDIGEGNSDIRAVLTQPDNPRIIYIGSNGSVLKTEDSGQNWRNILVIKGENRVVNFLLFSPLDNKSIYAATGNGLFYSSDQGNRWNRIFQGNSYLERDCTALAICSGQLYLGTKAGLFISRDNGRSWNKETGRLGNSHILAIAYNPAEPEYIYIACVTGVFKTQDNGQSWERVFVASPAQEAKEAEETPEAADEEGVSSELRYITIDYNTGCIYLASNRGIYISKDKGVSWDMLPDYGLLNRDVRFLLVSASSDIYAATKSGVFIYKNSRWHELSMDLTAREIYQLDLDKQNNIYAACNNGLFRANANYYNRSKEVTAGLLCHDDGPAINELQVAAIKYAEVEPDKIKQWRKKAQLKAILPKLTVGFDKSRDTNYEIYTSATTHYVYEGPEDRSSGWDLTLTWDLSELIWNPDQTSIDVRSRLMVQLRDDILDELTKLYFERKRVKLELDSLSIEEKKKRLEKELRVQELTASLDALTGGYFSGYGK